ncbi:MAG: class I SAM-dependent methyltransferase [Methanogenium sp.]|jgi:hypothetical protein
MHINTQNILDRYDLKPSEKSPLRISKSRWKELPTLFHDLGYEKGIEIGVLKGDFTFTLAQAGQFIVGIDPWTQYKDYRDYEGKSFEDIEKQARDKVGHFPNVSLIKGFSEDVVDQFADGSQDWIFLDGNHSLPSVIQDLNLYIPKVKIGGMICGHDYKRFGGRNFMHVVDAVNAWTYCYHISPWFLLTNDSCPSFFWIREQ